MCLFGIVVYILNRVHVYISKCTYIHKYICMYLCVCAYMVYIHILLYSEVDHVQKNTLCIQLSEYTLIWKLYPLNLLKYCTYIPATLYNPLGTVSTSYTVQSIGYCEYQLHCTVPAYLHLCRATT